jgi:hypothetical protein
LANSLIDSSNLSAWLQSRFDFDSPNIFLTSLATWLADAPTGVIVAIAATAVAFLAFTRRPGAVALLVLATLGVASAIGWAL